MGSRYNNNRWNNEGNLANWKKNLWRGLCILFFFCGMLCMAPAAAGTAVLAAETDEGTTEDDAEGSEGETVIESAGNGLDRFWQSEGTRLSGDEPDEGSFLYRLLMNVSVFCRRAGWILAILSFIVGLAINVVSGMNKPLRRVGVCLMTGVPILLLTLAFLVPMSVSTFYYGQ